jgi:hypothetical protein
MGGLATGGLAMGGLAMLSTPLFAEGLPSARQLADTDAIASALSAQPRPAPDADGFRAPPPALPSPWPPPVDPPDTPGFAFYINDLLTPNSAAQMAQAVALLEPQAAPPGAPLMLPPRQLSRDAAGAPPDPPPQPPSGLRKKRPRGATDLRLGGRAPAAGGGPSGGATPMPQPDAAGGDLMRYKAQLSPAVSGDLGVSASAMLDFLQPIEDDTQLAAAFGGIVEAGLSFSSRSAGAADAGAGRGGAAGEASCDDAGGGGA